MSEHRSVEAEEITVDVLMTGSQGGPLQPKHVVVQSEQDWRNFFPGEAPPMPNTDGCTIFLIGLGERPSNGYGIQVDPLLWYKSNRSAHYGRAGRSVGRMRPCRAEA
jgi:hypothetical protein